MECCWKLKPAPPLFPNLHTRVVCTLVSHTKANQHHDLMLSCETLQTSNQVKKKKNLWIVGLFSVLIVVGKSKQKDSTTTSAIISLLFTYINIHFNSYD